MPQTGEDGVSPCKAFWAACSCSVRDWRSVAAASDSAAACVSFCAASLAAFLLASRLVLAAFCLACAALVRCSCWEPKLAMSAASSCHSSDQLLSSPYSMSIRSILLCQCIMAHCKQRTLPHINGSRYHKQCLTNKHTCFVCAAMYALTEHQAVMLSTLHSCATGVCMQRSKLYT